MMTSIKSISRKVLPIVGVAAALSCNKRDDPADLKEHEEISKVSLKFKDLANQTVQNADFINGSMVLPVVLSKDKSYAVNIEYFQKEKDNTYTSMNSEIIAEKNDHFMVFQFVGQSIEVKRVIAGDQRTDGNIVGLSSIWKPTSTAASGAFGKIKLIHQPTSVVMNTPSVDNQQGSTTGGETDIELTFTLQ